MTVLALSCVCVCACACVCVQSLRFGERCSMVTNQTVLASTSVSGALALIDSSLSQCRARLEALEAQGRTHLDVYATLTDKYEQLRRRRRDMAGLAVA